MKLSVCIEMIFRELPLLNRIDAVAKSGYRAFEFWSWRSKDIDSILKKKNDYGLAVSSFGVEPMGRIVSPSTRDEFLTGVKESIETACRLECPGLIVTTGNEIENVSRRKQHASIVKSLREAAKIAEKSGITLLLEPLNVLVDHKGYYLYNSLEGFDIINEVNSPNIKLLYDIYHQQVTEGNLINTITKNLSFIGHFHAADVPGRHEPGTGEINYYNVFKQIKKLGYKSFIGLEYTPLKDSKESLDKVLKISNEM
jgi:hydroxypyruvate isomerase